MSEYILVPSLSGIHFSGRWSDSKKFDAYGKFLDKKCNLVKSDFPGVKYQICIKKERYYTTCERVYRAVIGVFLNILTLGFCSSSKSIRGLFVNDKKVLRFAVKVATDRPDKLEHEKTPQIIGQKIENGNPLVDMEERYHV